MCSGVECGRERNQRAIGFEHDRPLLVSLLSRDLRAEWHDQGRIGERFLDGKGDFRDRRTRRRQLESHQLEELEVIELRHLAEPVDEQLGHPREQLDQRDAGIRFVEIGPLGRVARDARARFRHEVRVRPVVDDGDEILDRHHAPSVMKKG